MLSGLILITTSEYFVLCRSYSVIHKLWMNELTGWIFHVCYRLYDVISVLGQSFVTRWTFHSLWTLLQKSDSNISLRSLQLFPLDGKIQHFLVTCFIERKTSTADSAPSKWIAVTHRSSGEEKKSNIGSHLIWRKQQKRNHNNKHKGSLSNIILYRRQVTTLDMISMILSMIKTEYKNCHHW